MKLTPAFIELMLETPAFIRIKRLIQNDGKSFSKISNKEYTDACREINQKLSEMLRDDPALAKNSKIDTRWCEPKTFKKIFCPSDKESQKPDEERRLKKLRNFLLYAQVEEKNWDRYIYAKSDAVEALEAQLLGYWYVYRMEYEREFPMPKRTILHISKKDFGGIKASFKSLPEYFEHGEVKVNGSVITFHFKNEIASAEISANINEEVLEKFEVLNGLLRSTTKAEKNPFAKHCVIARAGDQFQQFNAEETCIVKYTSHDIDKSEIDDKKFRIVSSPEEDSIFMYLSREEKSLIAKPFIPANIDGVIKMNRNTFDDMQKFAGKFLAYIPYAYENSIALSQIILEIDIFGHTTETVFYDDPRLKPKLIYHGHAFILNNTLRLSNKNEEKQKSEYLFKIDLGNLKPILLQGVTLDTDNSGYPCADACIAIRADQAAVVLQNDNETFLIEPKVIKKGTAQYDKLDKFLFSQIRISIEDYFFKYYRSIRYKKRED